MKPPSTDAETKTQEMLSQVCESNDMDIAYEHSRKYFDGQLTNVNRMLNKHKKELFFKRKYDLHTINEEQKNLDIKSLEFLLNLTT